MIFSNVTVQDALAATTDELNHSLSSGRRVVLLLSGGSSIDFAVQLRLRLQVQGALLTIGLIDERYGRVGHKDSNWQQLIDAGLDLSDVDTLPVLTSGLDLTETTSSYQQQLKVASSNGAIVVGILGIGADGHTAGILPQAPVLTSREMVASYKADDFRRITLTPLGLKRLDSVILYAYGAAKLPQLKRLEQDLDPTEQPAQLLKRADKLIVYNDKKGNV